MVTPCLPISRNRQYWPSWPPSILIFWESVPMAGELPWTESRCPTGRPFQMSRSSSVNGPICANSSSLANKILLPDTFCFKGFHFDAQLLNLPMKRHGATWRRHVTVVQNENLPQWALKRNWNQIGHLYRVFVIDQIYDTWTNFQWSYVVLNVAKNDKIKVFKFESKSTVANA